LPESDSTRELLDQLETAVRDAGALALGQFRKPIKTWTKGGNSPVCEVDIAADALLKERLSAVAPEYGWLSEESVDDRARLEADRVWIVDPIDGTRAYISGAIDWTISAALVENGRPVLAAVFAPASDEMFLAQAHAGATYNGIPIEVTAGDTLDGARIAGPQRRLTYLARLQPRISEVPKIHSLALRIARVAQGKVDAALAGGNGYDWDLAAADLLVHEAKGMLTTVMGEHLIYNRPDPVHGALVAASSARHRIISSLLREGPHEFR
jgi:myo-inositol-1(or 4)-monophosphatase